VSAPCHQVAADGAAATRAVVDDDRLPQPEGKLGRDDTRHGVDRPGTAAALLQAKARSLHPDHCPHRGGAEDHAAFVLMMSRFARQKAGFVHQLHPLFPYHVAPKDGPAHSAYRLTAQLC